MAYGSVNVPGARMATLDADGKLTAEQRPSLAEIKGGSNPNLLINWDFRDPVNRNGLEQYPKGVNLDRWICDGEVTLNDRYITVGNNFYQIIPEQEASQYLGKQVTLSVLYHNGILESGTITFPGVFPDTTQGINVPGTTNLAIALYANKRIQIFRLNGGPHEVVAVKTELGPIQTLAHKEGDIWVLNDPPNYALQYALCCQYSPITSEFVGSQQSNPNLLDNARWDKKENIINQKGQTTYSVSAGELIYCIDRWRIAKGVSIEILDNSIKLTRNAIEGFNFISQRLEAPPYGKKVTISILARGTGRAYIGVPNKPNTAKFFDVSSEDFLLFTNTFIFPEKDGVVVWHDSIGIGFEAAGSQDGDWLELKAVKLELGPVQTLAHKEGDTWVLNDPPPNYQQELAKCQRYQVMYKATKARGNFGFATIGTDRYINFNLALPVTLRIKPAITYHGLQLLDLADNQNALDIPEECTTQCFELLPGAAQCIIRSTETYDLTKMYLAVFKDNNESYLFLDANL